MTARSLRYDVANYFEALRSVDLAYLSMCVCFCDYLLRGIKCALRIAFMLIFPCRVQYKLLQRIISSLLYDLVTNVCVSVRKLLQGGTSPDACNDDGLTALHQVSSSLYHQFNSFALYTRGGEESVKCSLRDRNSGFGIFLNLSESLRDDVVE